MQLKSLSVVKSKENSPNNLVQNSKNPARNHNSFAKKIKNKIDDAHNKEEEEEEKVIEVDQEKIKR